MMLSIQFCLWVSCYSKLWALGLWNVIINSWLGVSSAKHNNSLQRKQRSQSLERARSPSYRGDQRVESLPPPWSGSGSGAAFISDPDMLASKLAEQEYLQGLGNWNGVHIQPPVWTDCLFVSDQAKSANNQGDIFSQLWSVSGDLSNGKFVKNISIYPSLQLTLVHPDMTREFEERGLARLSYLINPSIILHIINPWCPSSMRKL